MNPKHITSIKILQDRYCLKKDLNITLESVTLLVGEQGCGKSTLLELLRDNPEILQLELSDYVLKNDIATFYFDSEKMNPRTADGSMYFNPDGTSRGIGPGAAMASYFQSHGEVLKEFTVNRINDAKDCVLLLDEPESALSLRNQYKLAKVIEKTSMENNVQLIIATHCLPVIESVEMVYSLEHLKWMTSKEFIKSNRV